MRSKLMAAERQQINDLYQSGKLKGAARRGLPAIYPSGRLYVTGGGLISYGPDAIDQ